MPSTVFHFHILFSRFLNLLKIVRKHFKRLRKGLYWYPFLIICQYIKMTINFNLLGAEGLCLHFWKLLLSIFIHEMLQRVIAQWYNTHYIYKTALTRVLRSLNLSMIPSQTLGFSMSPLIVSRKILFISAELFCRCK